MRTQSYQWMIRTQKHAKALLRELFTGPEKEVKHFLKLLQSNYFSQDVAMLIHHINLKLAELEKIEDLEKD